VVSVLVKEKQQVVAIKVKKLAQEVALNQVLKVVRHRSVFECLNEAFTIHLHVFTTL
jgi:hypothetical protein